MAGFTIFGSNGFIGRHLVRYLRRRGHDVHAATRRTWPEENSHLGHTIFCIGITANFRTDPLGTVDSQVSRLADVLKVYRFDSFLYLSSTRVYGGAASTDEDAPLQIRPGLDHLYNLTKLAGESLILAKESPSFRVVRLSNVIGPGEKPVMFLPSVSDEARKTGRVVFRTAPESEKDYIAVGDVTEGLEKISLLGNHRLYNVAAGRNTTNREIATLVEAYLSAKTSFVEGAPIVRFPVIDTRRMTAEFQFAPRPFAQAYARALEQEDTEETE